MPRKVHKFHYIYKTTCIITNRFYIGMHSTNNLEDGYLGSGKRLWYSINKHGKENHKIEILEFLLNREELKKREKEIVNEELIEDKMCMNLALGGEGGFGSNFLSKEQLSKGAIAMNKKTWSDPEFRKRKKEQTLKLHREGKIKITRFDWTGKKHSVESIQKMKDSKKGHGLGCNNSQYGKCWITNENESKMIFKNALIPEGWRLGRKM